MSFVNLHVHSYFSHDGISSVEKLAQTASRMGQPALALTEHGVMSSWPTLEKACKRFNIKPIYGCEFYIKYRPQDKMTCHITVLIKNEDGYKNMVQLSKHAASRKKFWISWDELNKHIGGLIVLSGCVSSIGARALQNGDEDLAHNYFIDITCLPDGYLELQPHTIGIQRQLNHFLMTKYEDYKSTFVGTYDTHYALPSDKVFHDAMKSYHQDKDGDTLCYLGSGEEIAKLSPYAIDNTLSIAASVEFELPKFNMHYLRNGRSDECLGIARTKVAQMPKEYQDRLEEELVTITSFDALDYFSLLYEMIEIAAQYDIPVGPGRGSAAGCLYAYLLGITGVDPIRHELLFSRFLNPDRVDVPDIDLDFPKNRRGELLKLWSDHYGKDNIAQVSNYLYIKAKKALQVSAKALGIDRQIALNYSKMVPDDAGTTWELQRCFAEIPEFGNISPEWKMLALRYATTLDSYGLHACAIIVAPDVCKNIPQVYAKSAAIPALAYNAHDIEEIGYVKMDALGLETLDVLHECSKKTGLPIYTDKLDDVRAYQLSKIGKTKGVFQLDSDLGQKTCADMGADTFGDLAAISALIRPGPRNSGMLDDYTERKKANQQYPKNQETYGLTIYQEQISQMAIDELGYTPGEADYLRKAISKKKPKEMEKHRKRFADAGQSELFNDIEKFAAYCFNKSHTVAYAYLSYSCLYYKSHHPQIFAAAYINQAKPEKREEIVRMNPSFWLPPSLDCINEAVPEGKKVRLPLYMIFGVGDKAMEVMRACFNQDGPFKDLDDAVRRTKKYNGRAVLHSGIVERFKAIGIGGPRTVKSLVPYLGIPLGDDPIFDHRKRYTNLGYGNTQDPKQCVPGYVIKVQKKVAKKSGNCYTLIRVVDEFGLIEMRGSESLVDELSCVEGQDIIVKCFHRDGWLDKVE